MADWAKFSEVRHVLSIQFLLWEAKFDGDVMHETASFDQLTRPDPFLFQSSARGSGRVVRVQIPHDRFVAPEPYAWDLVALYRIE